MKNIAIAMLFVLFFGLSQAYPLQGGSGDVKATVFGAVRIPLQDQDATEEILKLDVGLTGTENATYELVDDNNYGLTPLLYKTLQPGRQMLYFIAPKDDLFKLLKVAPTDGKPFNINWWATPKGTNEDIILRYYGITDWIWDSDQQAIVLEIRVGNSGTEPLYLGPENFTLIDQWGWNYYPAVGFEPVVMEPQVATGRVKLGFSGISLQSRPAALAYDYNSPNRIIIDLEKDFVPLSDEQVYGSSAPQTQAAPAASVVPATSTQTESPAETKAAMAEAPAVQGQADEALQSQTQQNQTQQNQSSQNQTTEKKILSLKDQINASKNRLKGVGEDEATDEQSTVGKKISSSVEGTKERLAKARARLKENNQTDNQTA